MHPTLQPHYLRFTAFGREREALALLPVGLVSSTIRVPLFTRTGRVWRYVHLAVTVANGQPIATMIQETTR